jgi:restriction system protein
MPVPGYQDFMLPLLTLVADGQEHKISETIDAVADQLGLSDDDRNLLLPSGTQTQLHNRISWAITYLTKSRLMEKVGRGRFRIAPRGINVLKESPARIDNAFLNQFEEYRAFKMKKLQPDLLEATPSPGAADVIISDDTPEEQLEAAYKVLRETLADELLTRVRTMKPKRFEQLVVDVLVAMGYGGTRGDAAQVVGKSGDGGIDGVIKEDRLGLDMVYIQAKRYESDVGPAAIREFVGSLGEHKAHKGVFITCGGFTSGAREAAVKAHFRIVLIDGEQLAQFMIDHGVGVTDHKSFVVKRMDSDYFEED